MGSMRRSHESGWLSAILSNGRKTNVFHILNATVGRVTKNGKSVSKREIVVAKIY